jgi:hypothetical protein
MGYSPWMRNALLTVQTMVATTTATIFLFQMATLVASINAYFENSIIQGEKTYIRRTSKKEAAARARYAGS